MSIDYTVLKTEIQTDPLVLGYAGKTDPEIAALLNEIGLSGETINREAVPAREVSREVVVSEFEALSLAKRQMWTIILTAGIEQFEVSDAKLVAQIANIWAGTTTLGNLDTLRQRGCSRAEALFGVNTVIGFMDVGQALRW